MKSAYITICLLVIGFTSIFAFTSSYTQPFDPLCIPTEKRSPATNLKMSAFRRVSSSISSVKGINRISRVGFGLRSRFPSYLSSSSSVYRTDPFGKSKNFLPPLLSASTATGSQQKLSSLVKLALPSVTNKSEH